MVNRLRLSLVTTTPEVMAPVPVALLSGAFADRMESAARFGYDGVELMPVNPAALDGASLALTARAHGLTFSAIASGALPFVEHLTLVHADPEAATRARARLNDLLDFAALVGAPVVTIGGFRGRLASGATPAGARSYLLDVLGQAAGRAAALGLRIALEPLNRYESDIINTVDEGLRFVEQIGSPALGVLVDTYHANIEESSMTDCLEQTAVAGRLFHVHLGDSNRQPLGRGHIDFPTFFNALLDLGYGGFLSAELLAGNDPNQAAAITGAYVRSISPGPDQPKYQARLEGSA